ncbi:ABC transporter ATP-binding protein [Methylobacterium sp. J-090]|uniref:ABC transporter ATP-binding protein n=1 Tax=Methylobacterium sp. J-090 TaxID=2836666 RepID=UPI001FBB7930|nr:ABC transporter ATP-binding protein [Methylobacterium sp. J-090]MCJ2079976.1 ABC transporter ATP-binding protein [Methylobacterium sp. J-090]
MTRTDPALPPRLEMRGLGLRFGAVRALDGIDLAVRPGEIVALLGDSGCGKSTLLRTIAGLERPDRGTVRLDGADVGGVPPEARGVGLMFQDYALFPHLTVAENVRFGLHAHPGKAARAVATARLQQVGLADREAGYPGTLSGGESQRVALARALAPGPRILLLDEPFSNLDRRTRDRVRSDTLDLLRETGTTTILVTHDPEEALGFADRIALMRAGRIVQVGTGDDLYRRPISRFAARFFGDLVEVTGTCRAGHVATPFGACPAPDLPEGAGAVACWRPEAIRLAPVGEGLPGRVVGRRFLGATAILAVEAAGFDASLPLPVSGTDGRGPGDAVGLRCDEASTFIFADGMD